MPGVLGQHDWYKKCCYKIHLPSNLNYLEMLEAVALQYFHLPSLYFGLYFILEMFHNIKIWLTMTIVFLSASKWSSWGRKTSNVKDMRAAIYLPSSSIFHSTQDCGSSQPMCTLILEQFVLSYCDECSKFILCPIGVKQVTSWMELFS